MTPAIFHDHDWEWRFPAGHENVDTMKQYVLTIYQPDEGTPAPEVLDRMMRDLEVLNQEMQAKGVWVFAGGLHPPSTATVVRVNDGEVLLTDGPYVEGKEHVGGFTIIQAPDLDVALHWAGRLAEVTTLPVEVRPFQDEGRGESPA
jgi:hypothetical protein